MVTTSFILPVVDSLQEKSSRTEVFAYENRQAITGKFADLLTNVRGYMLKNGVDIEEFLIFVIALFPPGDCIPPSPTDFTKVFEAITRHGLWDYFHYSPLVQIVEKFGADDSETVKVKGCIQNYQKDLKAYAVVKTIEDYIESDLDTCTDQSRADCAKYDRRYNFPVQWKMEVVEHSLQYLADVWKMFSGRYILPDSPPTALLDRVWKGCVSVTWLVPSYLISQLIKRVKIDTGFFLKYRILKVTIGDEVVYEEEVAKKTTEVN